MTEQNWRSRIVGYGTENPRNLVANPRNWRTHPDHQRAALLGLLDEVGWVAEVLVNQRSGFVVDGHLRVASAVQRGETSVPVRYVDLDDAEERLVLASLDPIAAMATTANDQLSALLEGLQSSNAGLQALLRDLTPPVVKVLNPDDADLTPPEKPITQPGDLWLLGEHRLLCGDSTNRDAVAQLMDGEVAGLMMTDPPYGVDYSAIVDSRENQRRGGWPDIRNDAEGGVGLADLLRETFAIAADIVLVPDAAWFCWHPAGANRQTFRDAFESAGVHIHKEIIWVKPHFVFGRWEYHWQHEPCMYGWREHREFQGDRSESTVWMVDHEGVVVRRWERVTGRQAVRETT
jgi:hypothetical protein